MALYKIQQSAALPSGELAEWAWWVTSGSLADAVACATAAQTSLAASATWKAEFPNTVTFFVATVSEINIATGHVVQTAVAAGGQYTGSSISGALPPQIAVVVTYRSALAGKSNTGRSYLPGPVAVNITAAGRLTTVDRGLLLNAWKGALTTGVAAGGGSVLVVYSRTLHSTQPITRVDMGDVLDTQRRRRDKLIESRISVAFP